MAHVLQNCLIMKCYNTLLILSILLFAMVAQSSEHLAKQAFNRINWLSERPVKSSFVHIYGQSAHNNLALKKKLKRGKFARVINVHSETLAKFGQRVHAHRILRGEELGVPIEITQRIHPLDHGLIEKAKLKKGEPAVEVLQFRLHTQLGVSVVESHIGHTQGAHFFHNKTTSHLKRKIASLEAQGVNVSKIEIIHNHPVEAVEFYDDKMKSLGYFYNPISQADIHVGKQFNKVFKDKGIEIELAILVGLKKDNLFRVSYFPQRDPAPQRGTASVR